MMSEDDLYIKMERLRSQKRLKTVRSKDWSKHWKRGALTAVLFLLVGFFLILFAR